MHIHETLVSFPAERRADGCFYGDQSYWVRWDHDESGAVRLLSVPCDSGADLLSYLSADKRAETVRQITEKGPWIDPHLAERRAEWARKSLVAVRVAFSGAWEANDAERAALAKCELIRRGVETLDYANGYWPPVSESML